MIPRTLRAWLAIYPMATTIVGLIGSHVRDWPLPLRTLATSILIVPLVTHVSGPLVERLATALTSGRRAKRHDLLEPVDFLSEAETERQ